jgi:hypothetical protein
LPEPDVYSLCLAEATAPRWCFHRYYEATRGERCWRTEEECDAVRQDSVTGFPDSVFVPCRRFYTAWSFDYAAHGVRVRRTFKNEAMCTEARTYQLSDQVDTRATPCAGTDENRLEACMQIAPGVPTPWYRERRRQGEWVGWWKGEAGPLDWEKLGTFTTYEACLFAFSRAVSGVELTRAGDTSFWVACSVSCRERDRYEPSTCEQIVHSKSTIRHFICRR